MLSPVKQALYSRLKNHPVAYARTRAVLSRHKLPPGDLVEHDHLGTADRTAMLRRAQTFGPIFKGISWGELSVCVVGLDRCRDLATQHAQALQRVAMELDHIIPKGLLHAMEGSEHRHYRRATMRAVRGNSRSGSESTLELIASTTLHEYARRAGQHGNAAGAYSDAMSALATSAVTWLFFGAEPGSEIHERFLARLRALGPHGLVWNPQKRQEDAYKAFHDDLAAEVSAKRSGKPGLNDASLLGQIMKHGTLDETLLGNLIYQAEMGRSDLKNWFRWLTRHVTDDTTVLDRIRAEDGGYACERSLAEAFALETLRTDQSERMMRRATRDFVFDGFLFPQHASVRLCLWESHHLESAFERPHQFDPHRFLNELPGKDRYAPFGLGHHQCPMGSVVIQLGVAFLRALARDFDVIKLAEGGEVRGGYHWEPALGFAVKLEPR